MYLSRFENFSQRFPFFFLFLSIILIAGIGYTDHLTGYAVYISFFYLFPVILSTWFLGNKIGLVITFLTALTELFSDLLIPSRPFPSFYVLIWDFIILMASFLTLIYFLNVIKKLLAKEKHAARTDYLTQLPNRRYFFELSEIEINRANRFRHPLSLAYIDVDNFKKINDTFGHDVGDFALKTIAEGLKQNLRDYDIPARLGGDEFVILFPETGEEQAKKIIAKLHEKFHEIAKEHKWPIGLSIGVLSARFPKTRISEMIIIADNLMYQVKKAGKNNAIFLSE